MLGSEGNAGRASLTAGVAIALEARDRASRDATWIFRAAPEAVLARARALDALAPADRAALPLFGKTFAVKDNIDVAGWPTTAGCPAFAYVAERSATVVDRLLDAGAILLGKTNMDQFATGLVGTRSPYGIPANPFDARYIPGGSSSGSAVAVARGLVDFALGTDTAGSGRVPAACTGIVGLKPTHGLISIAGIVPACASLDCVAIFARTITEAAAVFDVAVAFDPGDPYARPRAAGPESTNVIAVPRAEQRTFCGDAEAQRSFERTLEALAARGVTLSEIDFTPFAEAAALLYDGPFLAERVAAVGDFIGAHPDDVHPVTRAVIEGGRRYSAVDLFRAQERLRVLRRAVVPVFARAGALLVPSIPTLYRVEDVLAEPFTLNAHLGTYTNFVNLLDLCAIAIPSDTYPDGRPIGITLVAPAFAEPMLISLAAEAAAVFCDARS